MEKIDFLDERYYEVKEGVFYPSATYILDNGFAKGAAFTQWLKDVGNNAKYISERAAESGSKVHNAIEMLIAGGELTWDDKFYDLLEWKGLLRFNEFYHKYVTRTIACEIKVKSDKYKYAGTVDYICEINGEIWLIDFKFGNAVYDSYYLQIAAYRSAWNEMGADVKIDRHGILHLKGKTKGEREGKIQGEGWQLLEGKNYEYDFKIFLSALNIHYFKEPVPKPKNQQYPATIKLEK